MLILLIIICLPAAYITFIFAVGGIKYWYLTIQERRHPRFHWDDDQEKASPMIAADISKPPDKQVEIIERSKPLSFSEVEDIVNQIHFKDYE